MNGETEGPRLGAEGLDDIGQDVGIILPRTDRRKPRTVAGAARSPRSEPSDSPASDPFTALHDVRLAARAIARDEALGIGRLQALVALVEQSRRDFAADAWLAAQAQRVIYGESYELLIGKTPRAPAQTWTADPVTNRLWALRRQGFERCRECKRPLPDEATLAGWEDGDAAMWAEFAAREHAPEKEIEGGDAG